MRSQKLALWIVAGTLTVFSFGASAPGPRRRAGLLAAVYVVSYQRLLFPPWSPDWL